MKIDTLFNESDLTEIRTAVHKAEANISGEIAPMIMERCSPYTIAYYRAFFLCGAGAAAAVILIDRFYSPFIFYSPLITLVALTAAALIGTSLLYIHPGLKKLFISEAALDQALRQRADTCFLDQELFNTRQRTGILILVALFEKKVMIRADKGIAAVVEQKVWDDLVASFVSFGEQGDIKAGLIKIITDCGRLLLDNGFIRSADDVNELSDDVRIVR